MVARGRGAMVLLTSGAAWAGGATHATYGATKAFDLILAESLWAEWHPKGWMFCHSYWVPQTPRRSIVHSERRPHRVPTWPTPLTLPEKHSIIWPTDPPGSSEVTTRPAGPLRQHRPP